MSDVTDTTLVHPPTREAPCATAHVPMTLGIDIGGTGCKLAALRGDAILWTVKRSYRTPSVDDLVNAIHHGLGGRETNFAAVGLCVPGILDDRRERVSLSVNVPALMDIPLQELVTRALGDHAAALHIVNNSIASGYD